MGLEEYLSKEEQMKALEAMAKLVKDAVLYPAAEKFVAKSDNPYDDMGLALVKQILDQAVEDIHKEPEAS